MRHFFDFISNKQPHATNSISAESDATVAQDAVGGGVPQNNFGRQNEEIFEDDLPFLPYPGRAAPIPRDPLLSPHGQVWEDIGEVAVDVGLSNRRARLLWPGNLHRLYDAMPLRSELEYFKLMFPMSIVDTMLNHTNELLTNLGKSVTTAEEMFKYFGIRLNMTLEKTGCQINDFWMTDPMPGSTFVPPNYGKFGMTRHRFQMLSRCMRFTTFDDGIINDVSTTAKTSKRRLRSNNNSSCDRTLGYRSALSSMHSTQLEKRTCMHLATWFSTNV